LSHGIAKDGLINNQISREQQVLQLLARPIRRNTRIEAKGERSAQDDT
jgi:hypothetical protein